mgnify:CR=1 FL=1
MEQQKILIIKAGYSEFLDKESDSRVPSLGDVIRTTPILSLFKNDHVTWVTDQNAIPLLEGNPFINRILRLDFLSLQHLEHEYFDTVINLEKIPGICALTKKISAWRNFGFRLDPRTGEVRAHEKASDALVIGSNQTIKKENKKTYQELLFEMLGEIWNKEEYILGYKPSSQETYDIALNTMIGHKWPTKSWPIEYWDEIEKMLKKENFKVTRQDQQPPKILNDLNLYMDWLNSAKLILSHDSLGMHLGLALKKKVLGLFGPTPHLEVYFYNLGKAILPEPTLECMPCFRRDCERGRNCMADIRPERVLREIKNLLNPNNTN